MFPLFWTSCCKSHTVVYHPQYTPERQDDERQQVICSTGKQVGEPHLVLGACEEADVVVRVEPVVHLCVLKPTLKTTSDTLN